MAQLGLLGGAYQAKSHIANAQRCINLFPEVNQEDAPYPTTHYPTAGTQLFSNPPAVGKSRCTYEASNGNVYSVVGNKVYRVSALGIWLQLGTIAALTTPVSMFDNGSVILLVDNTTSGYVIDLDNDDFSMLADPNFRGGTFVYYADGRFILNQPGTRKFYLSDPNLTSFQALNFASKSGSSDLLVAAPVIHREIWLIGEKTTEVWFNAGAPDFPYQIMPGVFIEQGCIAPYSIAKQDLQLYWLGRSKEGKCIVLLGENYAVTRVSTHAIEDEISKYASVTDALGYTYQQGGHIFYQLTFPSADKTWVYDVATKLWHEKAWIDTNGRLHRHRSNCFSTGFGELLVGDFETGALLTYNQNIYTDNGVQLPRIRSFPHIKNENKRITYEYLDAEFETGNKPITGSRNPMVSMRWSDNGGVSYGNPVRQSLGKAGNYIQSLRWPQLGQARDRVFELSWSSNVKTALNGASLDPKAMAT